jgi:hypothetical protein
MNDETSRDVKEVVAEFQTTGDTYLGLLDELKVANVPGVVRTAVAAQCNVGEVCHGGTFER